MWYAWYAREAGCRVVDIEEWGKTFAIAVRCSGHAALAGNDLTAKRGQIIVAVLQKQ
jgi:hypothetical protein